MASPNHQAVVTVAKRAPLEIKQLPTLKPTGKEVLVQTLWTASTPLDLHQADGGLLVKHPQVLGDGTAGQVVVTGPEVTMLKVSQSTYHFFELFLDTVDFYDMGLISPIRRRIWSLASPSATKRRKPNRNMFARRRIFSAKSLLDGKTDCRNA